MAGLFYLPRLFVYHADAVVGSPQSETFKIMEKRLMRIIMTPAMIGSFVFGIILIFISSALIKPNMWFHLKMLFVLILAGLQGYFSILMKDFAADRNQKSAKFFRVINEIPPLLMIIIIFLVVMKPF
jgi:putative membrane protein